MSRSQPRLALILVSALALSACGNHDGDDGPLQTERREAGSFHAIEMSGAARLEVTVGEPVSVSVEGQERAIERVRTEVRGDTLFIETRANTWVVTRGRPRVTIRITVPRLASLELEGGNDVQLSGFAGGASTIKAAGATRMKADGHLDELTMHMAGAGHADLSRLLADAARVTVDGVGSVVVHPKDSLDATMNGVGAILYTGSPRQVNTRMNGLGTIGQQRVEDEGHDRDDEAAEPRHDAPNPDDLQPEREDPARQPVSDSTEVI